MAKTKTIKGFRNTPDSTDFTFRNPNYCIVKFNAKTIVNIALDMEQSSASVRVTDTVSGKVYEGTAELQEVE